jgi:SAM-dependent methyltransferase
MPEHKDLFIYGRLYHWLLDPPLAEARRIVVNLVPRGSSVLDIACGTGLLSAALGEKECRAIGLDLSRRMLRFAERHNRRGDVRFMHGDAADLSPFADRSFDYATLLFLMHELPRRTQLRALAEAARVADHVLIVDSTVPLPRNRGARGIRFVEATFGRNHHHHFKAFLAGGGITGILEAAGLPVTVSHREVFWHGCREIVMVSRTPPMSRPEGA